jgi:raffinose/stachyose/melibiose transport system substrate-binding protein
VIPACAALALAIGVGTARPAKSGNVTLNLLATTTGISGWQLLIPNFERVYPNITVNATYVASGLTIDQVETTEIGAGNAPDLIAAAPGCGQPISVCELGKNGNLAPLVKEPWVKRSLPFVTSADKYGPGLLAFTPVVNPEGMFTNDDLFKTLGLTVPQTFPQLLTLCQRAKADGTSAIVIGARTSQATLIVDLALNTVYEKDKTWAAEQRAGKVTFDGTPGWHQALQQFVDMSNAGCFQPGAIGTNTTSAFVEFAQGQGLMFLTLSSFKGQIDMDGAQFAYSFHLLPAGNSPRQTETLLNMADSLSVNAHSSAANQAAAKSFIDFVARPEQNALYAQEIGGLTQYEIQEQQVQSFMGSDVAAMMKNRAYIVNPSQFWWNGDVVTALQTYEPGLLTGQETIDDVLNMMDAAWKEGPS